MQDRGWFWKPPSLPSTAREALLDLDSSNWLRANLTRSCTVTFKEAIRPCQNYLCYPVHHLFTVIHHDCRFLCVFEFLFVAPVAAAFDHRAGFFNSSLSRKRRARWRWMSARCSRLWPRSAIGQASSRFRKVPQRYFQQTVSREALRPVTSRYQRLPSENPWLWLNRAMEPGAGCGSRA